MLQGFWPWGAESAWSHRSFQDKGLLETKWTPQESLCRSARETAMQTTSLALETTLQIEFLEFTAVNSMKHSGAEKVFKGYKIVLSA